MEFLEESIIQGLVSEALEEECWGLEANLSSQVLEGLRALALGQGSAPSLQVPFRGLWCLAEWLMLLQLTKLPRLALGSVVSQELVALVVLAVLVA